MEFVLIPSLFLPLRINSSGLLQRTCRDVEGNGWDYDLSYGVIDAGAAVKALRLKPVQKKTGGKE